MNHLLYNFSIIMILLGIILLTHYLTKAYNINKSNTCSNTIIKEPDATLDKAFDERPSQIFNNMFVQPSINAGYEQVYQPKNNGIKL
jgi:hypothetical protein